NEDEQGLFLKEKFTKYVFILPRYFAVFFNFNPNGQKSTILSDENIRKALSYSVNKDDIINKISFSSKVDSPILPDFFGYNKPSVIYNFDIEKAKNLLDKAGFKLSKSNQREKPIVKTPAFQFKKYLKVGSKNTDVNQLQSCLARLDDSFKNILTSEVNGTYGKATEDAVTEFQKKYLSNLEPTGETGASTRTKLNELCINQSPNSQILKFTITTIDQPQLLQVAELIKDYWQSIGILVDINTVSITDLKPIIKNRNYDILLYGEALGSEPDLYPFWHSSQKNDPGLNLSSYENKDVDKLLKEARETLDGDKKKEKLEKLQDIIINNAPALFLYNPDYIYFVSSKVNGVDTKKIIDPAERFVNITNWYLKTQRVWK
ncbi:MAG: ABC transporter substrate-binding protein, partial [Nanoarchaeota archaeon]